MIEGILKHDGKKVSDFPKLMVGKNTGTIYLAIKAIRTRVQTVVLKSVGFADPVGTIKEYDIENLKDFNSEITLRNA